MPHEVRTVVPVIYVTDIDRSEQFYRLLGFTTHSGGSDETWRWAYLNAGEAGMLLASGSATLTGDPGPALLYVTVTDLEIVTRALAGADFTVEHMGYPDHAPGGEARVTDPDGHGVVLGQPTALPGGRPDGGDSRQSTLQAAAAAMQRRGVQAQRCQIGVTGGGSCERPAEVKLADSWGDTAWSCIEHADEVLVNARGAFIAIEDGQGLARYLSVRRRGRSGPRTAKADPAG
jgi:catechol 2,3-dioxygenase-like lactoylglutathione lyase family enzyme